MESSLIGSRVRPISGNKNPDRAEDQETEEELPPLNNNQPCLSTHTTLGFHMLAIFLLAQEGLMAAINHTGVITQGQGPALLPLSQKGPCPLNTQLALQNRCVFPLSTLILHSMVSHTAPTRPPVLHAIDLTCLTAPHIPQASQTLPVTP